MIVNLQRKFICSIIMKSFYTSTSHLCILLSLAYILGFTLSCNRLQHDHEHEEATEEHNHDKHDEHEHEHAPGVIVLSPEKAKAAGVVVSVAERGMFHDVIQTSGSITSASCDETTIVATVPGIVKQSQHVSEGMSIKKGTTIYYISSDHLKDGNLAKRAKVAYLAAKREYERAKPLVDEKIITQKEFTAIATEYENAKLSYEALSSNDSERGITIKAPETGYMKQCMVKDGDYVEMGEPLMVITKNQHLYLRAEVPVRYYSQLENIKSAKFRTQYSGDVFNIKDMHGELMSLGKSASSTSSYVPVTFQLDNPGSIVPGSYAEVFLITGERQNIISLPTTALTEEQGVYYVYIQMDEDSYRKQEVTLGATDGEYTEIKSGLQGGERVVTRGAINVKLAAASTAIPGHTHNH